MNLEKIKESILVSALFCSSFSYVILAAFFYMVIPDLLLVSIFIVGFAYLVHEYSTNNLSPANVLALYFKYIDPFLLKGIKVWIHIVRWSYTLINKEYKVTTQDLYDDFIINWK